MRRIDLACCLTETVAELVSSRFTFKASGPAPQLQLLFSRRRSKPTREGDTHKPAEVRPGEFHVTKKARIGSAAMHPNCIPYRNHPKAVVSQVKPVSDAYPDGVWSQDGGSFTRSVAELCSSRSALKL
eukprot:COSAG06_NODE_4836_length_3919_cov_4.689005_3_plen_128_part_00